MSGLWETKRLFQLKVNERLFTKCSKCFLHRLEFDEEHMEASLKRPEWLLHSECWVLPTMLPVHLSPQAGLFMTEKWWSLNSSSDWSHNGKATRMVGSASQTASCFELRQASVKSLWWRHVILESMLCSYIIQLVTKKWPSMWSIKQRHTQRPWSGRVKWDCF